jgi:hypothetical protein
MARIMLGIGAQRAGMLRVGPSESMTIRIGCHSVSHSDPSEGVLGHSYPRGCERSQAAHAIVRARRVAKRSVTASGVVTIVSMTMIAIAT